MVFGKHINKYYLNYLHWLVLGAVTLLFVDFFQLKLPELYRMVIDGMREGEVVLTPGEAAVPFDMNFVLEKICLPLLFIAVIMVIGRFLWRICFYGSAIKVETDIRREMFSAGKNLYTDSNIAVCSNAVRSKLVKSKIENQVLNEYVSTTRKFLQRVFDDALPESRNKIYDRYGRIVKNEASSLILNQVI